jgi:hypothetical protein
LLLFSLLAKGSNNAEALCVVFFYRQLMWAHRGYIEHREVPRLAKAVDNLCAGDL